jgi:hypothetical protein
VRQRHAAPTIIRVRRRCRHRFAKKDSAPATGKDGHRAAGPTGRGAELRGRRRRPPGSNAAFTAARALCGHARARGVTIPASSEAERPARAVWTALRLLVDVASPFLFSGIVVRRFGATMEVGRSGRSMMSAGAGASYGVIDNRSENLQHRQWTPCSLSLPNSGCRDRGLYLCRGALYP